MLFENEDKFKVIKLKSGRKYWKGNYSEVKGFQKGFEEKEWKEIENALSSDLTEKTSQNPNSKQQAQIEQPSKEIEYIFYTYRRVDNRKY